MSNRRNPDLNRTGRKLNKICTKKTSTKYKSDIINNVRQDTGIKQKKNSNKNIQILLKKI